MKFATVDEIHQKFFKINFDGSESNNLRWVRERLHQLEESRFLVAHKTFWSAKRNLTPTLIGYVLLINKYPEKFIVKPTLKIDIRTFNHDLNVLKARLHLEKSDQVIIWQSEKFKNGEVRLYKNVSEGEGVFCIQQNCA